VTAARRRAEARGRRGEWLGAALLQLKGYRILGRRVRTPMGEIDILASKNDVLAVVEVKARPTIREAMDSIPARQRTRLARAALWVMGQRPELSRATVRFDALLFAPMALPRHVIDAWRPSQ